MFIFAEILLSLTTQNNDVLSAKSFTVDSKLFEKPLIYIGTKKGSKDGALWHLPLLVTIETFDYLEALSGTCYLNNFQYDFNS